MYEYFKTQDKSYSKDVLSPDGKIIVEYIMNGFSINLMDFETGDIMFEIKNIQFQYGQQVSDIIFIPNTNFIAISATTAVIIYDYVNRQVSRTFQIDNQRIVSIIPGEHNDIIVLTKLSFLFYYYIRKMDLISGESSDIIHLSVLGECEVSGYTRDKIFLMHRQDIMNPITSLTIIDIEDLSISGMINFGGVDDAHYYFHIIDKFLVVSRGFDIYFYHMDTFNLEMYLRDELYSVNFNLTKNILLIENGPMSYTLTDLSDMEAQKIIVPYKPLYSQVEFMNEYFSKDGQYLIFTSHSKRIIYKYDKIDREALFGDIKNAAEEVI